MARLFKPLFAWLQLLWFLIILVLRLEQRILWSWFLVFAPIYFADTIMWGSLATRLAMDCFKRTNSFFRTMSKRRMALYLYYLTAKVAFQVMLCIRLDGVVEIALYWVLAPLYALLPVLIADATVALYKE